MAIGLSIYPVAILTKGHRARARCLLCVPLRRSLFSIVVSVELQLIWQRRLR